MSSQVLEPPKFSFWKPDIDVSDSEDEGEVWKRDFNGREAMLFVVDANLTNNFERFIEALEIIRSAFVSGLLVNNKDLLGVMFANTQLSPVPYEPNCLDNVLMPDNCAVFLPLRQLSKPIVEHFLGFLTTASTNFDKLYGVAENGSGNFAATIRVCVSLFENCGYSMNNSTIVYMTDVETPHDPLSHEYQVALQKAKDLEGRNIEFQVVPMVDVFDYDLFYKEFVTLARGVELDSFVPRDPQILRQILADRKLRQDILKRCLGHFNFHLGVNLKISVQFYNYFRKRKLPKKVKLLRINNKIVKTKNVIMVHQLDGETMEPIGERDVKSTEGWYEINLGNMPIRVTLQTLDRVRNIHPPGMMLLGFKPRSALPDDLYYKPCSFMYPDDQKIVGSKRLFCALWQRCMARDKIAVCLFMRQRKSIPRYVALVPVSTTTGEEQDLLSGDGFKIVYLPFAKHIRQIDFSDWNAIANTAPDEGVQLFEKIIKKLRIKYESNVMNDPTLEMLQSKILALALNIRTTNDGVTQMPNAEAQESRIAAYLPQFEEIFPSSTEIAKKRTAKASSDKAPKPKVAKISEQEVQSYEYVEQLIANKTISNCTVAQLRTILESHFDAKPSKATTKQALVERIYELHQNA